MAATPTRRVRSEVVVDAILALGFVAFTALERGYVGDPSRGDVAAATIGALAIMLRSLVPLPSLLVALGGVLVASVAGTGLDDAFGPLLPPVLTAYSVGARAGVLGMAAAGAATIASALASTRAVASEQGDVLIYVLVVGASLAVGRAGREIEYEADAERRRAEVLAREHASRTRDAVARERLRIARELHDVIGHGVSVMGVQAGAVRRRLADDQREERAALLSVEEAGRSALTELRRLLGVLRDVGPDGAPDAPADVRLAGLVEEGRRAGLRVELAGLEVAEQLPAGAAFTVARIVQESLTNAIRHAPGATVEVRIEREAASVTVAVVDDGAGRPAVPSAEGYGLVGIRERVAVFDGTLEHGPRSPFGYALTATLTVEDTA